GDPALGAERDVDVAAVPDSTRVEDALAATAPAVGREGGERSASTAVGDGRRGPEVAVFAAARGAASDDASGDVEPGAEGFAVAALGVVAGAAFTAATCGGATGAGFESVVAVGGAAGGFPAGGAAGAGAAAGA